MAVRQHNQGFEQQQHRTEARLWRLCQLIAALTISLWLYAGSLFIRMFLL
jgi:hypothetical protein